MSRNRAEKEDAPPISPHLHGRECVYGYVIPDKVMAAYSVGMDPPDDERLLPPYYHAKIYNLADSLGLQATIDSVYGYDDLVYFSYTRYGVIWRQVPIAATLECFAKTLGLTEKAQWLDARVPAEEYY
ncbi:hypothetical protein C8J57DRAFT_1215488 [Mycena rebaudengoi]|nr:hypothetical protein C8J57DRAFT_1215488 [Mycena rebaudengoi]